MWTEERIALLQKPFRMSILLMMARFLMEKAAHAAPVQTIPALAAARAANAGPAGAGDPFDELFEEPFGSPLSTL